MRRLVLLFLLSALLSSVRPARAALTWAYDFPGTPGSGVANAQTNPQDPNATFGDWNRVNLTQVGTANVFDTTGWSVGAGIDTTQYEVFTITAAPGYHLDLTQLTFDQMRTSGGPTKGLINMYVNGSATVWDSFNWNPTASVQNKTFDFIDTVDADNVTVVEFRLFGWNGGDPNANMLVDNMAVTVAIVPEQNAAWLIVLPLALALYSFARSVLRKRQRSRDA